MRVVRDHAAVRPKKRVRVPKSPIMTPGEIWPGGMEWGTTKVMNPAPAVRRSCRAAMQPRAARARMSPAGLFVAGVMVWASVAGLAQSRRNYLAGVEMRGGLGLGVLVICDGYRNGADDGLGVFCHLRLI
jgi:hypothetical protein